MDFFTVPTIAFGLLYCFFVISHDRRRILHFNVTRHPTSHWIVQQLREAFPYESARRFLLLDRDAKYGLEVREAIQSMNIAAVQTSFQSPWQNGIAERWVGTCRRELLDHILALNERHLRRLLSEFVSYYHDDRSPTLKVRQLEVSHPGADDDGLWFLRWPGSNFEVQIESSNGMCPFLIETDERDARCTTSSIEDTVETLVKLLHLRKPGDVHDK